MFISYLMCECEMCTDFCFEQNKFSSHWSFIDNLKKKSVALDHKI